MQQGDAINSYYQSHFQNLNTNANPNPSSDPQFSGITAAANPWLQLAVTASAPPPPVSSTHDYQNYYPSQYPPPNLDHVPNSSPTSSTYNQNPNYQHFQYPYDHSQPPYYSYDQNPTSLNYSQSNSNPYPVPNPDNLYSPGYGYGNTFEFGRQFDGHARNSDGSDERYEEPRRYGAFSDEGVYRYDGDGRLQPYGAPGSGGSGPSSHVLFDDYGRPIGLPDGKDERVRPVDVSNKVLRAIPKGEMEEDMKSRVQKLIVKVLAEGIGQSDMDVLCQRFYPFEVVTRWEVLDSYIFAFWAKTSVDVEPKRIRLKSTSYTTNTILDLVTAASVQLKEMYDGKGSHSTKDSDQPTETKKGFADWMNLMKPPNEEKDHWVPDEAVSKCTFCSTNFGPFVRRHHCRNCGDIFCDKCTQGRTPLTTDEQAQPVRVCDQCMEDVTQRLTNAREATNRVSGLHSHEDLARRLKEEMNKNLKSSSGSNADGSKKRMHEVACPTCTVHLQVQVPSSGSERIECRVCQHPFLVSAH